MRDATKSDCKDNSEAEKYHSNDMWGDQRGDEDADMSDGAGSFPSLLNSHDVEPHDPFAEMCEDSPRSAPNMNESKAPGAAQG
eukprot:10487362-Karenia_brevis.AAC.1